MNLLYCFPIVIFLSVMLVRKSKELNRVQSNYELFRTVVDSELKKLPTKIAAQLRKSIEEYVDFDLNGPTRTVPIKKSIRNKTLAEVLANPFKFPTFINPENQKKETFVVTFAAISHPSESNDGVITPSQPRTPMEFLVEAEDDISARTYAKRFEHIALYWTHSITTLEHIRVATPEDLERLKFKHLSGYESMFPDRFTNPHLV